MLNKIGDFKIKVGDKIKLNPFNVNEQFRHCMGREATNQDFEQVFTVKDIRVVGTCDENIDQCTCNHYIDLVEVPITTLVQDEVLIDCIREEYKLINQG